MSPQLSIFLRSGQQVWRKLLALICTVAFAVPEAAPALLFDVGTAQQPGQLAAQVCVTGAPCSTQVECGNGACALTAPSFTVEWGSNVLITGSKCFMEFDQLGCFDPDGPGPLEVGDGQFHNVGDVATDDFGNVYVVDIFNYRIQKFDSNGAFITKWGDRGILSSGFGCVDPDGAGPLELCDGEFNPPKAIAVHRASGSVYVVDGNGRVQKFDSSGTFITKWGSLCALENGSGCVDPDGAGPLALGDGQFRTPRGISLDQTTGNIYVVDGENHRVQKFDSAGNFIAKWGSQGSGSGQFINPFGVTIDSAGRVYVADLTRVQKFDADGNFIAMWGVPGSGDGEFSLAVDIAVDQANHVYVLDQSLHHVQIFDSDGNFITKFGHLACDLSFPGDVSTTICRDPATASACIPILGDPTCGDGQFNAPNGLDVAVSGNVYVADMLNFRVQNFAPADFSGLCVCPVCGDGVQEDGEACDDGNAVGDDGCSSSCQLECGNGGVDGSEQCDDGNTLAGDGCSSQCTSEVCIGGNSTCFVDANCPDGACDGVIPEQFLLKWGSTGSETGQFDQARGAAVAIRGAYGAETLYIADGANDRITVFDTSGNPLFPYRIGRTGTFFGRLQAPFGVAVESDGDVYVADRGNHRVQKFSSWGRFLLAFGSEAFNPGSGDGEMNGPHGVALDSAGNVYVADSINHRVQKFTNDGQFILKWGTSGSGNGQFNNPWALAIDGQDNVYVVDRLNNRVQKFDSAGTFLFSWGPSMLQTPTSIAIGKDGGIYVGDHGNTLRKFDSQGNFIAVVCVAGTFGDGECNDVDGVAIDSSGDIYAVNSGSNIVQKFGFDTGAAGGCIDSPAAPDNDGDGVGNHCDEDDDNDGVLDKTDLDPLDPDVCEDVDGDSCDDCSVGTDDFGPLADNDPANDGPDADGDGLCDAGDPCPLPCVWDIDLSGDVRVPDLIKLLSCWGPLTGDPDCACLDIDGSGDIRVPDLIALLAKWGPCS